MLVPKPDETPTKTTMDEASSSEETPTHNEGGMFSDEIPETSEMDPPASTRPDYVPEAFWDVEAGTANIQKLAESREHFRAQYQKTLNDDSIVPESLEGYLKGNKNEKGEYIFQLDESSVQTVPSDDPVMKAHLEISKDLRMTDKQSDQYISRMMAAIHASTTTEPIDTAFEQEKLGKDGASRVTGMKQYLDLLEMPKGAKEALASDIAEIKNFMSQKAGRVQVMEALMREGGVHNLPPQTDTEMATRDEYEIEYDKLMENPTALDESPRLRARLKHLGSILYPD